MNAVFESKRDALRRLKTKPFKPSECPHCEYDRRFPDTASGGWMYLGNGHPIVCCPICNWDESHPRD